ncbi:hypothetical protein BDV59DRAFT_194593 [Aspergillus ambiguus]|uniref:CFEM domain-containing protein n=1 Tax=Aspergillus ambiguus TaxID=176160 RepID=UPI003CCDFA9E
MSTWTVKSQWIVFHLVRCICQDTQLNAQLEPCILQGCTVREALKRKLTRAAAAQRFSYATCQYPTSHNVEVFPIVNIVGIIVAILSVSLRVAGRVVSSKMGRDDYTIVVALLTAAAISGVGFPMGSHGLGRDIWMVAFEDISKTLKLFFIEENLYVLCIAMIKSSMLLLYLRLFPTPTLRGAVLCTLAFTTAWGLASFFAQVFSCNPISYYWLSWDGQHRGKCVSHNALLLAHAIINIILDVVVIGLPMPTLLKLRMSLEKRIGMCLMFAVGIVVTIISILRLVEAVGFNSTTNPTMCVWSILEVDIGIMCSCMPGIRASCKYVWAAITRKNTGDGPTSGRGSSRNQHPLKASKYSGGYIAQNPRFKEMDASPRGYSLNDSREYYGRSGEFIRLKEVEPMYETRASKSHTAIHEASKDSISSEKSSHGKFYSKSHPGEQQSKWSSQGNLAHMTWLSDGDS